jgi:hypothetical protein
MRERERYIRQLVLAQQIIKQDRTLLHALAKYNYKEYKRKIQEEEDKKL